MDFRGQSAIDFELIKEEGSIAIAFTGGEQLIFDEDQFKPLMRAFYELAHIERGQYESDRRYKTLYDSTDKTGTIKVFE